MKEIAVNKHYTFEEYWQNFPSIQDSYDYYFEQQKEIERLNRIINEMEQFFIDNANDEMKKCFDKLHRLKDSDKE